MTGSSFSNGCSLFLRFNRAIEYCVSAAFDLSTYVRQRFLIKGLYLRFTLRVSRFIVMDGGIYSLRVLCRIEKRIEETRKRQIILEMDVS